MLKLEKSSGFRKLPMAEKGNGIDMEKEKIDAMVLGLRSNIAELRTEEIDSLAQWCSGSLYICISSFVCGGQ